MHLSWWIAAGCVVVVQRMRRRHKAKDLYKIPLAPNSVPVLGNVGLVKALGAQKVHEELQRYAEAAGTEGVLRLCILGDTRVVVTTPGAFTQALRRQPFLLKPAIYDVFLMFGVKRRSLFNTPDGAEHARIRQHLMKFFNVDNISRTVGQLSAEMQASISLITAGAAAGKQSAPSTDTGALEMGIQALDVNPAGVLVDAFKLASFNILRVVFKVFLEVDMTPPLENLADAIAHANAVSAVPFGHALLKRRLYPGYRRYRRNFDALYNFHCDMVRAIYSKPLPQGSTAFWAAVRYAFPNAMADEEEFECALANAAFIYAAGYETTSNAITHTLAALALDQDSQTAVAEELAELGLLATAGNPSPRGITAEDLPKLKVLDAVCHESLRMFATAPSGGLRLLKTDTQVGPYMLAKGTAMMFPVWALHHNKHVWGEHALEWRPDRWLEGHSVAAAKKAADGNLRFMTFLDGPSNCIGQHLALVELKMVVASLVSNLHITMDAQRMGHLSTVEQYLEEAVTRLTLTRQTPAWLRMKPRGE